MLATKISGAIRPRLCHVWNTGLFWRGVFLSAYRWQVLNQVMPRPGHTETPHSRRRCKSRQQKGSTLYETNPLAFPRLADIADAWFLVGPEIVRQYFQAYHGTGHGQFVQAHEQAGTLISNQPKSGKGARERIVFFF